MNREIMDGNKLIAEFMGYKLIAGHYVNGIGQGKWFKNPKYFYSWDAIMPVVKKIKTSLPSPTPIEAAMMDSKINLSLMAINLSDVWDIVIEFIQWYNQQK
jgi:hypothetical protein